MKRYIFPSSIGLIIIVFSFVFYQLLFVTPEPFPKLTAENYIGFFPGSLVDAQGQNIYFSVEPQSKSHVLKFIIYQPGWGVNYIEFSDGNNDKNIAPVIFSGSQGILRFSGRNISNTYLSGTVTNVSSGKSAEWILYSNPDSSSSTIGNSLETKVLSLKAEQDNLLMQVNTQQQELESTAKELTRVAQVLAQGKTLEQKADSRFNEKQSEIENLKEEIAKAESALSKMQASLSVSRSITQRGRLTTMARESLFKEYKEIDFKLSGETHQSDAALIAELAVAQEALALKRQLENEGENDQSQLSEGLELN